MRRAAFSCSQSAHTRGEPLHATALRYQRFLLVEVPGPWGRSALTDSRLDPAVAGRLAAAAAAASVRIVLIRRPGRQPDQPGRALAWAIADTACGTERIRWGSWTRPADLAALDLIPAVASPAADPGVPAGPQRVALVCTNAKRDQCCAIRGRPVAAAVATTGWDTWECSHLGGHRFAATMLLLPSGEMFGRLDPAAALAVLGRFGRGEISLDHHRGTCGQPPVAQAGVHAAATRLGECHVGALRVSALRQVTAGPPAIGPGGDVWHIEVEHRHRSVGALYRLTMRGVTAGAAILSCADTEPKSEVRYQMTAFRRIG